MKTLLVLAPHPDLADSIRGSLDPERFRVIHRSTLEEAEPLVGRGMADVCILDVELTTVQGIWVLEKLRRLAPNCPLVAYTSSKDAQWEEEAYIQGVAHVLAKPVRPRMLLVVLDRLLAGSGSGASGPSFGSGSYSGGGNPRGSGPTPASFRTAAPSGSSASSPDSSYALPEHHVATTLSALRRLSRWDHLSPWIVPASVARRSTRKGV